MFRDVSITRLSSGCRIAVVPMPQVESVSLGWWMGVGGRHERAAEAGHSHFLEHMVFKGTARRSARKISQAIEGRGGYLNAFTQQESTCFYARVPAEWAPLALDVLSDMVCAPRLAPADVALERAVILEELAQYRDQPDAHVFDLAAEALWTGHALGRPLVGSPRTLAGVTSGSLEAFRRRHYRADGAVLVVAGRVDPDEWVARVTPHAMRLPQGDAPGFRRAGPATRLRALAVDARAIEQTHLVLAFRGFGRHDPRRHALRVLNVILGENMSSRLFQSLRERRGLAYSVASSVQLHADSGALLIGAALDPARAEKAAALCVAELDRLRERPVGWAELVRARDYVVGQLRLGLETPESRMNWLGETLTGYGAFLSPDETIAGCRAVTSEDLQTLARSLFHPSRASLALVLPKDRAGTTERLRAAVDRLDSAAP